jgi:hypothetical protein
LYHFFVREKENLLQAKIELDVFQLIINGLHSCMQRGQQSIDAGVQRTLIDNVKEFFLPYDTSDGEKLNEVVDVLNYSLRDLIEGKPDAEKPKDWSRIKSGFKIPRTVDDFERLLQMLVNKHEWSITDILPESSFGIFFRMPSWVAELVLLVIEHNVIVKDQLIEQGYRAFWPLKRSALPHSKTPSTDFKSAFEGVGEDIPEDYFSVICGYNIRECPLWVPRPGGFSFSGHGISQEHRDLLKMLADEYRQRVVLLQEEEEEEGEEEGGGEAMEASEAGKTGAGANQETGAADSSVPPPASTDPAAAGVGQVAGAAGSSGSRGQSKQIRTHVFSATEVGAAIAAASEAVSSGPGREFDGLVKSLSSCREQMAVEPVVHFKP